MSKLRTTPYHLYLSFWLYGISLLVSASPPPLTLATVYQPGLPVEEYWVSEKYDGFRAYWDGKQLLSRQGNVYAAPVWFIENFPALPMDGELWAGRQQFETVASIVRQQQPHAGWQNIRFMVFDFPAVDGSFDQRLAVLRQTIAAAQVPWLQAVPQFRVTDAKTLQQHLDAIIAEGAEGLMLHRGTAYYRAGRSDDLIKLKLSEDAEATVVAYLPGHGKYQGMMGALLVETAEGSRFRIGSGFTDEERRVPPPLGSVITYQFNGYTQRGIPRFARYHRQRQE
jgi:DNA ligase-1